MSKVAIVMPAFNAENTVERAVRSVLSQTHSDFQLFIVDDASTDGTVGIVESIASLDDRVTLLSNCRSKGPSGARNTGLEAIASTDAEFFAFLDADDIWFADHLEQALAFLGIAEHIDAVMLDCDIVDEISGRPVGTWFSQGRRFHKILPSKPLFDGFSLLEGDIFGTLLNESFFHLQCSVLRCCSCGALRFDEQISHSEDRDFALQLTIEEKAQMAYKKVSTGTYYRRPHSLSAKDPKKSVNTLRDQIFVLGKYVNDIRVDETRKAQLYHALRERLIMLSVALRCIGDFTEASRALLKSAHYGMHPNQFRELLKTLLRIKPKPH